MFGDKDDKRRDERISAIAKNQNAVIKNQQIMIKNESIHWSWIQKLTKDNQAQTNFDNEVAKSLKDINTKLAEYIELAKIVKTLQQTSHTHEAEE